MERRSEIDGLRALAVVPIVLFHAGVPCLSGGFVGVDVFYVISGFLITRIITSSARFRFLEFYERRVRRLFPALFAMVALVTLAAAAVLMPFDFEDFSRSASATLLFASNVLFWRSAEYFAPESHLLPLLHTWSLGIEEQFYLLYPAFLLICAKLFRRRVLRAVAMGAVGSFALSVWCVAYRPEAAFYLLPFRAWELLLGAVVALAAWAPSGRIAAALGALGAILLAAAVVFYSADLSFPGLAALPPCLGAALLIWTRGAPIAWLLDLGPVRGVGLMSYSLYFWHWPIIALYRYRSGQDLDLIASASLVAVIAGVAYLSWRFIEEPVRRRQVLPGRPALFASAVAAAAVLLAIGAVGVLTGGLPQRLPSRADQVNLAARDRSAGCDFTAADSMTLAGLCHLGAPGRPRALLWGDSHAWALRGVFDQALQATGQPAALASRGGCPPLLGIDVDNRPVCAAVARATVDLVRREQIGLVIVVANWRGYPLKTVNGVPPSDGRQGQIFARAFDATLAALEAVGAHVVLVDPVPGARGNVPRLLAQREAYGLNSDLTFTRAEYSRQNGLYYGLAASHPEIPRVPLADAYCGTGRCLVIDDGRPAYFDAHHLAWSSRLAVPKVQQSLQPLFVAERAEQRKSGQHGEPDHDGATAVD